MLTMADERADHAPAPEEPTPRRPAPRLRDDSEKALGLEVAKLFGLSPRLLMTRRPKPTDGDGGEPTGS